MFISRERFELALDQLKNWEKFEHLASIFLVSDFSNFRTVASSNGDLGRDGELFCAGNNNKILFQFSIQETWSSKLKLTLSRIEENFPEINTLIYVTNKEIGAKADKIKGEFREKGFFLDVMDKNWFLERANTDNNRSSAAEALAKLIVDPLLSEKNLFNHNQTSLDRQERRTAFVFLEMQREDGDDGQNLTKLAFDALVKASLHDTDSNKRKTFKEIHNYIEISLPRHSSEKLKPFIISSLERQIKKKKTIKFHTKDNTYHISHEEKERIREKSIKIVKRRVDFENEIKEISSSSNTVITNIDLFTSSVKEIIEKYFLKCGEEFAESIYREKDIPIKDDLKQITMQNTKRNIIKGKNSVDFTFGVVNSILSRPSLSTFEYLKMMSDGYTLMSFLSETPDVQKVTNKLFSYGNIWLDTTVILPLFAEQNYPENQRPFTEIFDQLKNTGIKLYVTDGVIREIDAHLNMCLQCSRSAKWSGDLPYVYGAYILYGSSPMNFGKWLDHIKGEFGPEDDIIEYLSEFGIEKENPICSDKIPSDVVTEIKRYWEQVQDQRRKTHSNIYSDKAAMLARHDAENCLTVLSERLNEPRRPVFGYQSWWLTLDSAAFKIKQEIDSEISKKIPHSPVMSLDFLIKYLSFGPVRNKIISQDTNISRIFSPDLYEHLPRELVEIAQKIRNESYGMEERVIQRKIRDALDQEKAKIGDIHKSDLDKIDSSVNQKWFSNK
ncbi:MAG: hypothetical protein ABF802_04865 [Acetobacter orientalis]